MLRLPVLRDSHERADICGPCGGKCCKALPGISSPEEFGAPDVDVMRTNLRKAFATGRWAIDWYEGDPRDGMDDVGASYFVRPAVKGEEGELFDPSWGGECTFLGAGGCEIRETRPSGCRALIPSATSSCETDHGEHPKRRGALEWLPYISMLSGWERRPSAPPPRMPLPKRRVPAGVPQ